MKLKDYIDEKFSKVEYIDYVDLFQDGEFMGMYSASFALKGKHLALDPMENGKGVSYCFPMNTVLDDGGVKFNYCGSNFELTIFRTWAEQN